ncbi:MAG: hypothetical protein GJU72_14740 [Acidithiobacillus ferriphilus]|nr:hypothetical protein [Acidithiobacillus ferriphilus]MBW9255586.1 hypothetical protein [Acidithiobacillus ferriphilus]
MAFPIFLTPHRTPSFLERQRRHVSTRAAASDKCRGARDMAPNQPLITRLIASA